MNVYLGRLETGSVIGLVADVDHRGADGKITIFGVCWPFYRIGGATDAPFFEKSKGLWDLPEATIEEQ